MNFESVEMWDAMRDSKYRTTVDQLNRVIEGAQGNAKKQIETCLSLVIEAIHAEAGTFWFYDQNGDGLIHPVAIYGGGEIQDFTLLPGEGIAGQVIESGEGTIIQDCQKHSKWSGKTDQKSGFLTKTMICVPLKLKTKNSAFGSIQIINRTDGGLYDKKDLELTEQLAKAVSVTLEKSGFLSVMNSKNQYLDGKLLRAITEGENFNQPENNHRQIAVLFADVCDFTNIYRRIGYEKGVQLLNEFLTYITTSVKEHGGIIDKYCGDNVMALWGGVDRCENPAKTAVQCATEIMDDAKEFVEKMEDTYDVNFQFRIGIHFGEAYIGNIGTPEHKNYTAIGETVSIAHQLKNEAPDGKILISESVAEFLNGNIHSKVYGKGLKVKGMRKALPMRVLTEW